MHLEFIGVSFLSTQSFEAKPIELVWVLETGMVEDCILRVDGDEGSDGDDGTIGEMEGLDDLPHCADFASKMLIFLS